MPSPPSMAWMRWSQKSQKMIEEVIPRVLSLRSCRSRRPSPPSTDWTLWALCLSDFTVSNFGQKIYFSLRTCLLQVEKAITSIDGLDAVVSTIGGTTADPLADSQVRRPLPGQRQERAGGSAGASHRPACRLAGVAAWGSSRKWGVWERGQGCGAGVWRWPTASRVAGTRVLL